MANPFHNTALKVTPAASYDVKTNSNGKILSAHISNLDAAVAWLNVYDAADHTAVSPGTTTPIASFSVAASGQRDVSFVRGLGFSSGCVVTGSTADGGGSAGANGLSVTIEWE